MQPRISVGYVARCHGLSPTGAPLETADAREGKDAVRPDDEVAAPQVRLEERVATWSGTWAAGPGAVLWMRPACFSDRKSGPRITLPTDKSTFGTAILWR